MKKFLLFLITAISLGLFLAACQNDQKTNTAPKTSTQPGIVTGEPKITQNSLGTEEKIKTLPAPNSAPKSFTGIKSIVIGTNGFEPNTVEVPIGTEVVFINNDTEPHWPASDPHPSHTLCPGFDALKGLAKGKIYKFTFTEAKTCSYHDHLNPSIRGTITVK